MDTVSSTESSLATGELYAKQHTVETTACYPRQQTGSGGERGVLARLTAKRREVAVILPTLIVPVDAKSMHMAASRFGQSQPGGDRMPHIIKVDWVGLVRTGHPLNRLVE